ncbi:glycosyltransferase [Oleiharenicola lentus]|uniref:glycosyltransferase n=1 Tax=Oleiharenicola lentus TaxID=2508720 RepID=UPI003F6772D7
MSLALTVIVPTHNPHPERLRRTLASLRAQGLPHDQWETLLIDNASTPPVGFAADSAPENLRIVRENNLGLTSARRRGFQEARGEYVVMADDDNVLAPDYLERVIMLFKSHAHVGALGGKSVPEFEIAPAAWTTEFFPLLALRDLGDRLLISNGLRAPGETKNQYPDFAPIGAGMALRREAIQTWLAQNGASKLSDRRGTELTSGGDNDIVFHVMRAGWEVAYFPELQLIHLIPEGRLSAGYFARLNYGIQKSWMQVLSTHDANPWPPISPFAATLRKLKAWVTYRAWSSPAAKIRWKGTCGHFDGRVSNN